MAVIIPNVDDLKAFIKELKKQSLSKRQRVLADAVVEQFDSLMEYAEDCTKELNMSEDDKPNQCYGYWGDGG